MVYRFIDNNKAEFGLRFLLSRFKLYPNSYYNYLKQKKSDYLNSKEQVKIEIRNIYYNNNRIIGHRGMVIFLKRKGFVLSKATVHKYMNKELCLHSVIMRRKPKYVRGEKNKIYPNLIKQNFNVSKKNSVWCTDFTYMRLANGKMRYNCSIIDLYDRSVVGTLNSKYINTDLAIETLKIALEKEKPQGELILHSDQGCQFTSWSFADYCKTKGIRQSMSKSGCPYDNAAMERFYNTFKNEFIYLNSFADEECLDSAVKKYIYLWYNHLRPHSHNNWKTPYEKRYGY